MILAAMLIATAPQASAQQPGNELVNSQQPTSQQAAAPRPFVATYEVSYRGIGAGTLTFTLSRDPATGQYTYETSANPSMLARFVIGRSALERSVMEIGPQGVRPLEWHFEDGKSGDGDGALHFDWSANKATGKVGDKNVDLALEPGVQDRQSMQISVATTLLRGQEPGAISLIDDNRVKRYNYERQRTETLDSKLGKLDTVVYQSTREGSNRLSRFWLVPKLEYVAARAEQVRKGKVETVMVLIALEQK
jgi:hypothetical protein